MAGLTTPATLQALRTSIFKNFQNALDETPIWSDKLFTDIPSSTNVNTYEWMAAIGEMREWIGPRAVEGLKERVYQISNKTYEKTIGVQREKIDDSDVADAGMAARGLAEAGKKLPDLLLKSLLQNGHLSSATAYDGQNFFDTDHPTDLDGTGTQANYFTTTALTAANFRAVRQAMYQFRGENNRIIAQPPRLVLAVPPALEGTGEDIVVSPILASGATNVNKGKAELWVIPDLAGQDTTWYMFFLGSQLGPFIKQVRRGLALTPKTSNSDDNVFWDNQYIWGIDTRIGAGYGLWQRAAKAVA